MTNLKIGARQLNKKEVESILPTYDEIFAQIKNIRSSLKGKGDKEQELQNTMQKTNNISILGPRGAGKTSVLKTIIQDLQREDNDEDDKNNDIILPIIVPENMSDSSTLMATILGLFKKEVDKIREEEKKKSRGNCISDGDYKLNEKYNEAIKKYTFIQKEYRSILINEFTTENEYVKKSNEIFNSDIEFITKFNDFIETLIELKGGNPLIFFFIDDIDLSTSRCTDVVKTLLSYISHKNVVTFISGDLDTFEEALTIDFLRQEGALSNQVWDGEFLNNNERLIERKRILSYEYLKKVVPPVYRHNIKRWSLEQRGEYKIGEESELEDLLTDTLKEYVKPSFFKYKTLKKETDKEKLNTKDSSNENKKGKKDEKREYENLPYIYHLFDDTSRGLNNVYNVLTTINHKQQEQINEKEESSNKIPFNDKKMLIEIIAASKPVFNEYRDELFNDIINFGNSENSTVIRFDNLTILLDAAERLQLERIKAKEEELKKKKEESSTKKEKEKLNDEKKEIKNEKNKVKNRFAVKKFQLLIFVDFVSRLLEYNDKDIMKDNHTYKKFKKKIIKTVVKNPSISGSSIILKNTDKFIEMEEQLTPLGLVSNFLLKSEIDFALTFYKYLSMDTYEFLTVNNKEDSKKSDIEILQKHISTLYFAIKSVSEVQNIHIQDYIAKIYSDFIIEFAYIQDSLSGDEKRNTVEFIYEDTYNKIYNSFYKKIFGKSPNSDPNSNLLKEEICKIIIEKTGRKTNDIILDKFIEDNRIEIDTKENILQDENKELFEKMYREITKKIIEKYIKNKSYYESKKILEEKLDDIRELESKVSDEKRNSEMIFESIHVQSEIEFEKNFKRLLNNFHYKIVKEEIFTINNKIDIDLDNKGREKELSEDELGRLKLINNINRKDLWDHPMTVDVKNYINKGMREYIKRLFGGQEPQINVEDFNEEYLETFEPIKKGGYNTKANQLDRELTRLMNFNDGDTVDVATWVAMKSEVKSLAHNNRVWYGQYEAQKMLNGLNKFYPVFKEDANDNIKHHELIILLHYYAIHTIKDKDMDNIYLQSKSLSEFVTHISLSQGQMNSEMINDFMEAINDGRDNELSIEKFQNYFKTSGSAN